MRYPSTTRLDLVETLHGVQVTAPYRWLEDPATPETVAWSQAQAELFDGWMAGCPGRRVLRDRVGRLLAAGLVSAPAARRPGAPGTAGAGGGRVRAGADRPQCPVRGRHRDPGRMVRVAGGHQARLPAL